MATCSLEERNGTRTERRKRPEPRHSEVGAVWVVRMLMEEEDAMMFVCWMTLDERDLTFWWH